MSASDFPYVLPLEECRSAPLVGGKAVNLHRLIAAGFPVPGGFAVTTAAFAAARAAGSIATLPSEIEAIVLAAYRALGSPAVAVRSSATAEDLAEASMAGQYETILDVRGESALIAALLRCWASLDTPRVRSYLAEHAIPIEDVHMAVAVQRLLPSEVAGVLFTANPHSGRDDEFLVDASYGLGESVVSGAVQPDQLVLSAATGAVLRAHIGSKETQLLPGRGHAPLPVPDADRARLCLDAETVRQLWQLGLMVARYFGSAQDIEWGLAGGKVHLLQSRAVTTLDASPARLLQRERERLAALSAAGRGPWVVHNLGESAPHPTPLTWSLLGDFMSGSGGFGELHRLVGYAPVPGATTVLERIAGRLYLDTAANGHLYCEGFPLRFDPVRLRAHPAAAQEAPSLNVPDAAAHRRLAEVSAEVARRLAALGADFDRRFTEEEAPAFAGWVHHEQERDLTALNGSAWAALWREREARVLGTFAPLSLIPTFLHAQRLQALEAFCAEHFHDEEPGSLAQLLAAGGEPDRTLLANEALARVGAGELTLDAWLADYGHRAPEEFELASPRWRERRAEAVRAAARLHAGPRPLSRHAQTRATAEERATALLSRLSSRDARSFTALLSEARRYARFREDGKFELMRGYSLLRDLVLDAARRLGLPAADVCLLNRFELLAAVQAGLAPLALLSRRRAERAAEAATTPAPFLDAVDLPTLGEPPAPVGGDRLAAFPIAPGSAGGIARIVNSPDSTRDLGSDYVLVCTTTDPSWTPLFTRARALVIERGGALSHGAVVARELGLPAVVLPGATRLLRDGEPIWVDGHTGALVRGASASAPDSVPAPATPSADDPQITRAALPPPRSARERRDLLGMALAAGLWLVYFALAFWLAPDRFAAPVDRAFDALLLPLVRAYGYFAPIIAVAVTVALLCTFGQRLLTDNARLGLAKRRAASLLKEAAALPRDSARATALRTAAAPVQGRIMAASFVPLAWLLGPMVMSLTWLTARVDLPMRPAPSGTLLYVTAEVAGDHAAPVVLNVSSPLTLETAEGAAAQTIPLIRRPLEKLLAQWSAPSAPELDRLPWEAQAAARQARESLLADLRAFLSAPLPTQALAWTVQPTADAAGVFRVSVGTAGQPPLIADVVLGDGYTPVVFTIENGKPYQLVTAADPSSSVRALRVAYAPDRVKDADSFWRPFAFLGWMWDAGWLGAYLAVYLPAFFLLRWLFRLA